MTLMYVFMIVLCWMLADKFSAAHTAVDPVPQELDGWMARHKYINKLAKLGNQARLGLGEESNRVDMLYIGDSIVQKFDTNGHRVWSYYYKSRNAINLGISGDRTEHVLWRLQHGNIDGLEPKLAVVMIGQNNAGHNSAEEIADGVAAIVDFLRAELPNMKILLIAIFQRGKKPNDERQLLTTANSLLSTRYSSTTDVSFMDINHLLVKPDGSIPASLFPDYEHPSEKGFMIWADAIESTVATLLGDTPKQPMTSVKDGKVVSAKWKGPKSKTAGAAGDILSGNEKAETLVNLRPGYSGMDSSSTETNWLLLTFLTVLGVICVMLYSTVLRMIRSDAFSRLVRQREEKTSEHGMSDLSTGRTK